MLLAKPPSQRYITPWVHALQAPALVSSTKLTLLATPTQHSTGILLAKLLPTLTIKSPKNNANKTLQCRAERPLIHTRPLPLGSLVPCKPLHITPENVLPLVLLPRHPYSKYFRPLPLPASPWLARVVPMELIRMRRHVLALPREQQVQEGKEED